MLKLNAPAEIHWRRSNTNKRDHILMKSVEVLKDCRSVNAADEMNCPMPRSVEKVTVRNEKRLYSGVSSLRRAVTTLMQATPKMNALCRLCCTVTKFVRCA